MKERTEKEKHLNRSFHRFGHPFRVAVFSLFVLSLAGCASRHAAPQKPSTGILGPLAKQYDASQVEQFTNQMDARFAAPGFKGVHLGMTCDEVNQLVAMTPWGYMIRRPGQDEKDQRWPDEPQCLDSNFLGGDNSRMGRAWLTADNASRDRKDHGYPLNYVQLRFVEGKLALVNLAGPGYPEDFLLEGVKEWGRSALSDLLEKHGDPVKVNLHVEDVSKASFQSGYETTLYEWKLPGGERIALYICEIDETYGCGIMMESPEALSKTGR